FLAIYLLSGVGGGIASIGWNPERLSVGASGAIFGLAGALIASFAFGEFSLPRSALGGVQRSLIFFVGFNLVLGNLGNLSDRLNLGDWGNLFGRVDNSCHAGGLITGLLLGTLIAKLSPHSDAPLRRVSVLIVVTLAVCGSAL